ncbi:hypothetical protein IW148_001444 [Coemansia sp. RSA 1199]|nr:hypothetical protein IW148_001444 [Coemansia sp. RSA 1199]
MTPEAGAGAGDGAKRKHSTISTPACEFDLSLLDPPRPGRPCRQAAQDPAMQEARKRARVLRNRAAAQNSREKKRQHVEQLEQENAELRDKNAELEERLSRAEESNAGLAARLDGLAQQLQGFQALVLGAQKQPALDWGAVTPLVASPMHTPTHSVQAAVGPSFPSFTPSPSLSSTLTPSLPSTLAPALSSTIAPTLASTLSPVSTMLAAPSTFSTPTATAAPANAEQSTEAVSASTELSSKGLSESAVLEQSGAQAPDSQQRRPLQYTESICRKPGQLTQSLAMPETRFSTSSCTSWGQQMANTVVEAVVKAAAESSPQAAWTIFCVLWWVLSQSGGWITKPLLSRMARGILEHSQPTNSVKTGRVRVQRDTRGVAGLAAIAAWLGPGSHTSAALRRVVGNKPVDQVAVFVAGLRTATRSASLRRQRVRVCTGALDKQKPLYSPP